MVFKKECLERATNFKNSRFKREVRFNRSQFNKNLAFVRSQFDNPVNFGESLFNGKLFFLKINFENIYFDWRSIEQICRKFDDKIYLSLIETYKARGFFEWADECYYQFRKESRNRLTTRWRKLADFILMASYGYGVKPKRTIFGFIAVLLAFSFIYAILFSNDFTISGALNKSLLTLLSGTKIIEVNEYHATGLLFWMSTLERILGSIFFFLFLVSVGRTIVR